MSLDVYLKIKGKEVFSSNITHNLGEMAKNCGIYRACWRPDELGISKAKFLIPLLKDGLEVLEEYPQHYDRMSSPNGWGLYVHFVPWIKEYLHACEEYPEAKVCVSR